jgi:hypothetical protein
VGKGGQWAVRSRARSLAARWQREEKDGGGREEKDDEFERDGERNRALLTFAIHMLINCLMPR